MGCYQTHCSAFTRACRRIRHDRRGSRLRTDHGVQRHHHRSTPNSRQLSRHRHVRRTRRDPRIPVARRRERRKARRSRTQGAIPRRCRQAPPGPCARRRVGGQCAHRRMRSEEGGDDSGAISEDSRRRGTCSQRYRRPERGLVARRDRRQRPGSRVEIAGRGRTSERGRLPLRRDAQQSREGPYSATGTNVDCRPAESPCDGGGGHRDRAGGRRGRGSHARPRKPAGQRLHPEPSRGPGQGAGGTAREGHVQGARRGADEAPGHGLAALGGAREPRAAAARRPGVPGRSALARTRSARGEGCHVRLGGNIDSSRRPPWTR